MYDLEQTTNKKIDSYRNHKEVWSWQPRHKSTINDKIVLDDACLNVKNT